MSADTGGIPQILKSAPQWLAWKYGERDGKTYINVWYIVSLIAGVVSRLCLLPAGTYYRIMRFQKILSLVLILLLITSVTVPTASASASGFVPAAAAAFAIPATADLIVNGALVTIVGSAVIFIGDQLGKRWDETEQGWNQLLTYIGRELTKVVQSRKMIAADSRRGEAILAFDYYTAGAGDKKPDKLYHKAKKEKGKDGKVKIDPQRISEDEAVKELREGRDIFGPNQELTYKVSERASEENYAKLKAKNPNMERYRGIHPEKNLERHGGDEDDGFYDHYHPKYQNTRPHAWMWMK